MMRMSTKFLIGLIIIIFMLSFTAHAESVRGGGIPILIGFGEYISPVKDLPDSKYGELDIGYYYNSIKIFFIPILTCCGKFVLYEGDRYRELSDIEVKSFESEYGSLDSKVNFWIRYINWFWIIVISLVIGVGMKWFLEDILKGLKKHRKKIEFRIPSWKTSREYKKPESIRSNEGVSVDGKQGKSGMPLRKVCIICGNVELLLFKCSYCKNIYCSDHHLPENHNCSKLLKK